MRALRRLALAVALAFAVPACGAPGAFGVPVLSSVDAVALTLEQALAWAAAHAATAANVAEARDAIAQRDFGAAVDVTRRVLAACAAAGEPVPSWAVALVDTAEGAIASKAVQDGMRAVSVP